MIKNTWWPLSRQNEIPDFASRVRNERTIYGRLWAEARSAEVEPRSSDWGLGKFASPNKEGCDPWKFFLKTLQICAFWMLLDIKFEFVMDAGSMAQSRFPWLFSDLKKIPDFSRFSRKLVTLKIVKISIFSRVEGGDARWKLYWLLAVTGGTEPRKVVRLLGPWAHWLQGLVSFLQKKNTKNLRNHQIYIKMQKILWVHHL